MRHYLGLLLSAFVIQACVAPSNVGSNDSQRRNEGVDGNAAEAISGFNKNSSWYKRARGVGAIKIYYNKASPQICSAVVLNSEFILTSYHCVPGKSIHDGKDLRAISVELFLDYDDIGSDPKKFQVSTKPSKADELLDYAILKVGGSIPSEYRSFKFLSWQPELAMPLTVVHQMGGGPKRLSRSNCFVAAPPRTDARDFELFHRCATLKGSSGGAILLESTNQVIAIHRGGPQVLTKEVPNDATLISAIERDVGLPLAEYRDRSGLGAAAADSGRRDRDDSRVGELSPLPEGAPNEERRPDGLFGGDDGGGDGGCSDCEPRGDGPGDPGNGGDGGGGDTGPGDPGFRYAGGEWATTSGPEFGPIFNAKDIALKYCSDSWGDCGFGDFSQLAPSGHDYRSVGIKVCANDGRWYQLTHDGPRQFTFVPVSQLSPQIVASLEENSDPFRSALAATRRRDVGDELLRRMQGIISEGLFSETVRCA